jgi:potassium efflux system protein
MNLQEVLSRQLFEISGTAVTIASVASFVLIMLVAFWVSSILRRITAKAMVRGGIAEPGTVSTVQRLLHYAVLIVGLAVGVQTIGISLASLFAAGAVVAVAIGFALQNVLQNFVSGVILLTERSITEHDVLEVQGQEVVVERLGARATVARTRDDDQLIIPNSVLVQSTVTNLTLADNVHRIRTRVGVAYGSDMEEVERVLLAASASIEDRVKEREPLALLLEFGDSSVVWELSIWCNDPWAARVTRSDLNKAIWRHFKAEGITIAFPQLDVHVVDQQG